MILIKHLSNNELERINGGSVTTSILIGVAVAAFIIFLSGIIEGYTNPERCANE